jgi:hypothetical protein
VRSRGFEPPQDCSRYHLKVVRLPFRHDRFVLILVPKEGLEPSHPKALAPKASVSTISPPGHIVYRTIKVKTNCKYYEFYQVAETERFGLSMAFTIHPFQGCALDHYATSPRINLTNNRIITPIHSYN